MTVHLSLCLLTNHIDRRREIFIGLKLLWPKKVVMPQQAKFTDRSLAVHGGM